MPISGQSKSGGLSSEPIQGTTTHDNCSHNDSDDHIDYVQVENTRFGELKITVRYFPSSSGVYTSNYGISMKLFDHNDTAGTFTEIKHFDLSPSDFTIDSFNTVEFLYDLPKDSGSNHYIRAALIDKDSSNDELTETCADSDAGGSSDHHYDNADVSLEYITSVNDSAVVDFDTDFLLKEDGGYLLLESGDKIIQEPNDLVAGGKAGNATVTSVSKS